MKGRLSFTHTYKGGSPAGTHLLGFEYDYDSIDNRLHMYEITGDRGQTTTRINTESYAYDELSRLTNVTYKDNSTQAYTFDHVGNRLTMNDNGTQKSYTYNSINELTSGTDGSWTYDLNGNTLTDPGSQIPMQSGRSYTWDVQNRMTSCTKGNTTVNFTYRADGLRARKQVVGGTTTDYVYDGQTVIGELVKDTNGTVTKKVWYTPGPNGYINRTETNASDVVTNKEWFVYDGLGSCRAMVKPNAAGDAAVITARFDYDVYGKVRTSSGSTTSSFKYVGGSCGHPTDDETGLIYMRARYMDPGTGRFVGEDPRQDGNNWFRYANCNPVNALDLSGCFVTWGELLVIDAIERLFNPAVLMSPTARVIGLQFFTEMLSAEGIMGSNKAYDIAISGMSWGIGLAEKKGRPVATLEENIMGLHMLHAAQIQICMAVFFEDTFEVPFR